MRHRGVRQRKPQQTLVPEYVTQPFLERAEVGSHKNEISAPPPALTAADLVFENELQPAAIVQNAASALQDDLRQREWKIIVDALRESGGNRARVADKLGISPRTLRYKLARMRDDGVSLPGECAATDNEITVRGNAQ
jgi:DNA-binding NtrC family response regulator